VTRRIAIVEGHPDPDRAPRARACILGGVEGDEAARRGWLEDVRELGRADA